MQKCNVSLSGNVMVSQVSGHWSFKDVGKFIAIYKQGMGERQLTQWADLVIMSEGWSMDDHAVERMQNSIRKASEQGLSCVALVNFSEQPLLNMQSELAEIYRGLGVEVNFFDAQDTALEWLKNRGFHQVTPDGEQVDLPLSESELMNKN
ncbi:hypothetical protein OCL06_07080 [Alteromonas sp. ASW11-19]|uniref:STAS/SEC14 domain-containing protein n=1 Tax=Alteromonas salexigens TaxID=2982530 RepID=A0ABT2VNB6_9ALTE|nr:hypothetical protein [Alteromonas salexigens]MCU7554357.1 hypothetical protein [Alteromonas salexigens]